MKTQKTYILSMAFVITALALMASVSAAVTGNTTNTYYGPNGQSVTVTQTTGSNEYGSAVYYNVQTSYGGNYGLIAAQSNTGAIAVGSVGYSPVTGTTYAIGGVQSSYGSYAGGVSANYYTGTASAAGGFQNSYGTYGGATTTNDYRTAYIKGGKNPSGNVRVNGEIVYH